MTHKTHAVLLAALSLGCAEGAGADGVNTTPRAGERLNFVSCPIVRDTEMVPCWLAEHEGELYYLGIQLDLQADFFPPQLKHEALIEGIVADQPRICGGIVLEPVRVAALPELNLECNTILPAEGYKIENARRGTGPDPDTLSARNQAIARVVQQYTPPYETKTFTVYFDFDSEFMPSRSTRVVTEVMRYVTAIGAKRVEITAHRGAALLSNGKKLTEMAALGEIRARKIQFALADIGVEASKITARWQDKPEKADGVDDYETRRVVIVVKP